MRVEPKIDEILSTVQKPLSYVACEQNSVYKERADLNFCLIFPDIYELGINSLGVNILYSALNKEKGIWAQRAYMPGDDMRAELGKKNVPLFSMEERRGLNDFDVIGFSLPHELCYTNVLQILKLSSIPLRSEKRNDDQPIVIAGGCGAFNPVVLSPFIDAFVIGDGEEVAVEIAKKMRELKGGSRDKKLDTLKSIKGVWVPKHSGGVERRILPDINQVSFNPLVPVAKSEKRVVVEIARGCTAGCRFCQAGFIYRPLREKEAKSAHEEAVENCKNTGLAQLSLLSLSTSDYSQIHPLADALSGDLSDNNVSISLPSLRIDDFSIDILKSISRVKKSSLTFAVEAGSQRLRDVINKHLSEEQILTTLKNVFLSGWHKIKLYFMVGLPTEGEEDMEEMVELVYKIRRVAQENLPKNLKGRLSIVVSVSNFVPKPHTPFQWVAQDTMETLNKKHDFLKDNIRGSNLKLKWHDSEQSTIEGLIARGDEKVAEVIEKAFDLGAKQDNFSEHFNFEVWQKAIDACNLDIDDYLRERSTSERLPWDFVNTGIEKDYLLGEYKKSFGREDTPDCRSKCSKCGLCDKTIKNIFSNEFDYDSEPRTCIEPGEKVKFRVILKRSGLHKYLSHLDWVGLIERKMGQTGLSIASKGKFNPRPKISFSSALPVGYSSDCELVDFVLYDPPTESEMEKLLRSVFDGEISFVALERGPGKMDCSKVAYEVVFTGDELIEDLKALQNNNDQVIVKVPKKEDFLSVDLKECILNLNNDCKDAKLELLCSISIRPDILLKSYAIAKNMDIQIKSVKKIALSRQEKNGCK